MMARLQLIDFKADHAHIMVNGLMNDPLLQIDEKLHNQLNGLEVADMSFTAIHDNNIICAAGVIPIWEGVFEGWIMGTELIWQHQFSSAKIIKIEMQRLIKYNKIIRLQTPVKKDFILGHRFAEWLGMKQEGLMTKYQNNEDYYRYARIND